MRCLILAFIVMLAGCVSPPDIRTDQDRTADFGRYRTFGFATGLGTDAGGYSSLTTQRLKEATSRELLARGYVVAEREPDLLVNFYARIEDRLRVTPGPVMPIGGYYGYRRGFYGAWPGYGLGAQMVDSYREGTLNVDLIDRARNQMVWEGVAVGGVTSADEKDPAAAIDRTVALIFARYPFRAGTP